MKSLFQLLFKDNPNYGKLRVFGCLCFPWLRPYTSHKLEPRSLPCVFLGYCTQQSVYKCLEPTSGKIYISRDVKFVESQFQYKTITSTPSNSSSPTLSWFSSLFKTPNPSQPLTSSTVGHNSIHSDLVDKFSQYSTPSPTSHNSTPSNPTIQESQNITTSNMPCSDFALVQFTSTSSNINTTYQPNPTNTHLMVTRSQNNIYKPKQFFLTSTTSLIMDSSKHNLLVSYEPSTIKEALVDPQWSSAVHSEYDALIANETWDLVPYFLSHNLISCGFFT